MRYCHGRCLQSIGNTGDRTQKHTLVAELMQFDDFIAKIEACAWRQATQVTQVAVGSTVGDSWEKQAR